MKADTAPAPFLLIGTGRRVFIIEEGNPLQGTPSLFIKLFHRHIKAFVTAGTVDGMCALDTRQT